MTNLQTVLCAALLLLLPPSVFAQGVEQNPTGVQDMEPGTSQASDASGPAWLGVMMEEDDGKVRIKTVVNGSPADRSALEAGDIIEAIGGTQVESADDVQEAVRASSADTAIEVEIRRGEQSMMERVQLEAAPGLPVVLERHFVGHPAPALEWVSVASPEQTNRLESYDRPVVVEFWATWCSPCKPMRDYLGRLSEHVGSDVAFVAVSSEDIKRLQNSGARENARGSAYIPLGKVEESVLSDWIIEAYPTVFVIRADGTVAGAFTGLESRDAIGRLVRELAADDESESGELLPAK